MADALMAARVACTLFVEDALPDEADLLDEAWDVLLPVFNNWTAMNPSARRFPGKELSTSSGLGFHGVANWALPIGITVVVATVMELWEAGEAANPSAVRSSVKKYARSFGAPKGLQALLAEKVPPLCIELQETLAAKTDEADQAQRALALEESFPDHQGKPYSLETHDQEAAPVSIEEVAAFKSEHGPEEFFVWVDESQGKTVVGGEELGLKSQMRRVLMYLVGYHGQRIAHDVLVNACGKRHRFDYDELEKTSRRWVSTLRKAGTGQLKDLLRTEQGGFVYEGPNSYCFIRARSEFELELLRKLRQSRTSDAGQDPGEPV